MTSTVKSSESLAIVPLNYFDSRDPTMWQAIAMRLGMHCKPSFEKEIVVAKILADHSFIAYFPEAICSEQKDYVTQSRMIADFIAINKTVLQDLQLDYNTSEDRKKAVALIKNGLLPFGLSSRASIKCLMKYTI